MIIENGNCRAVITETADGVIRTTLYHRLPGCDVRANKCVYRWRQTKILRSEVPFHVALDEAHDLVHR
jgi:hypothetical protein